MLQLYASHPENTRGRLIQETPCSYRNVFQRDRDRIIHSSAFRRLQYKTQVFVNHEGDHYRTRLTHSVEVAQISRTVSRSLGLSEDLAEVLALAHDIGHPPFGHAGEQALSASMSNWGGFDHNAHTLKIVTKLEENYGNFNGLNLSFETLEGIVKHNGPLIGANISPLIAGYNKLHNLDLSNWPSLEAQVVSLCDDIAYNSHDIEDGVKAGLISIDGISSIAFVRDIVHQVKSIHGNLIKRRLVHEVARRITNLMVQDLVSQTKKNLVEYNIKTAQDVRNSKTPIAGFSQEMEEVVRQIKSYLLANMYRHYKINKMTNRAMRIIKELYEVFEQDNSCLPAKWYKKTLKVSPQKQAIIISDFIAGMTDRFAIKEHAFFLGVTQ